MTATAKDVMQSQVLTVSPYDPLHAVQRLFYEEGIHGTPVIDETGQLLGIVTSTDILRAAAEAHELERTEPVQLDDLDFAHGAWGMAPEDFKERLPDVTVADVMTESVIRVALGTSVSEIARTLRENQVHRVLVVEGDRLCGIVSAFDLIALLEE
jgi:CBS domain-containing protein